MPSICSYIAADLHDDGMSYPRECKQEFGMSETDGTQGVVTLIERESWSPHSREPRASRTEAYTP